MNTKTLVLTASLTIVLLAAVSLGVLQIRRQPAEATTPPETAGIATSTDYVLRPTTDWRSYENTAFHFALRYPPELTVEEYPESDGAFSTIFRNATTGQGFQVYVTPYEHAAITKERLELDVPSGVMDKSGDVFVDGVRARTFLSTNSQMGGTYEVWVINNGFLYEAVTHDVSAPRLDAILQTWQFI